MENIDKKTVRDFGLEWDFFDQSHLTDDELHIICRQYFKLFPTSILNVNSVGIDIGCGSGRWAKIIAPKVKKLYCIDASQAALNVAKKNLTNQPNVVFFHASIDDIPLDENTLDFAYSLGVLHHIPDTLAGIKTCIKKIKSGAPFLVYLYYAFDNKPYWFRLIWKLSDYIRQFICRLPFKVKLMLTQIITCIIYFPLARLAQILEKLHINIDNFPLSAYRKSSFYVMRTDALDRFGTRLEQRFTKNEIISMLEQAGLINIQISTEVPYYCAIGYKS